MTLKPKPNRHEAALRKFALSLPEAEEEFPSGHRADQGEEKDVRAPCGRRVRSQPSVKLPRSRGVALTVPFASPTVPEA